MKYLLSGEGTSHASLEELVQYHIEVSRPVVTKVTWPGQGDTYTVLSIIYSTINL